MINKIIFGLFYSGDGFEQAKRLYETALSEWADLTSL